MSVKSITNLQLVVTSQRYFSCPAWTSWLSGAFKLIGDYFPRDPKPLSGVALLPKISPYSSLNKQIKINFIANPLLVLPDKKPEYKAAKWANQIIANLQEIESFVAAYDRKQIPREVAGLTKNLERDLPTYFPVPDVQCDMRTQPSFGFYNPNNNCFINAVLQIVFAVPFLVKNIVFGKGQNTLVLNSYKQFIGLLNQGNPDTNPDLASPLRGLNSTFAGTGQHDASEFLLELLNPLEKNNPLVFSQKKIHYYEDYETHKAQISPEESFDEDGGRVRAQNPGSSLQLSFPHNSNTPTIEELIHTTFDETVITDDTVDFKSVKEKDTVKLKLKRSLAQINPPSFIFVELKRHLVFKENDSVTIEKNSAQVSFQQTFHVPSEYDINGVGAKYEWVAFANQLGSHEGGHYVTYVATDDGKFHCYSDTNKTEKTKQEFLTAGKDFYLGIARRVDCTNVPGKRVSLLTEQVDKDIEKAINDSSRSPYPDDQKEINLLELFVKYLGEDKPSSIQKLQKVYDSLSNSFHQFARNLLLKDPRNHLLELRNIDRQLLLTQVGDKVATNIVAQYAEVRKQNLELTPLHRRQPTQELNLLVIQKERLEHLQTLDGPDQFLAAKTFGPDLEKLIRVKEIRILLEENALEQQVITNKLTNASLINR